MNSVLATQWWCWCCGTGSRWPRQCCCWHYGENRFLEFHFLAGVDGAGADVINSSVVSGRAAVEVTFQVVIVGCRINNVNGETGGGTGSVGYAVADDEVGVGGVKVNTIVGSAAAVIVGGVAAHCVVVGAGEEKITGADVALGGVAANCVVGAGFEVEAVAGVALGGVAAHCVVVGAGFEVEAVAVTLGGVAGEGVVGAGSENKAVGVPLGGVAGKGVVIGAGIEAEANTAVALGGVAAHCVVVGAGFEGEAVGVVALGGVATQSVVGATPEDEADVAEVINPQISQFGALAGG